MSKKARRGHSGRKLRNLLLDGPMQLRYVAQMVLVSAGLTAGLGWLVYRFNAEASRVVSLRVLDPTDEGGRELQVELARGQHHLLVGLIAFGVVLSLVLAGWQLVTTHKIAGPLHYLSVQLGLIRDGHLGTLHPLRRGDQLQRFFATFREMHQALRKQAVEEAAVFERLARQAEAGQVEEVALELRRLKEKRVASLD